MAGTLEGLGGSGGGQGAIRYGRGKGGVEGKAGLRGVGVGARRRRWQLAGHTGRERPSFSSHLL